jgi:hypothetical protein
MYAVVRHLTLACMMRVKTSKGLLLQNLFDNVNQLCIAFGLHPVMHVEGSFRNRYLLLDVTYFETTIVFNMYFSCPPSQKALKRLLWLYKTLLPVTNASTGG